MNEEEIRELIRDFKFYTEESKRLHGNLGDSDPLDILNIQIGSSKKEDRIRRKLEKMERKTAALLKALEEAGLTDKEWSVVDCVMEGMSYRQIAPQFGLSRSTVHKIFESGCKKLIDYLDAG